MSRSSTRRGVEAAVSELCRQEDVDPVPQVVIRGRNGGSACWRGDRYVIRIGHRLARAGGPELRGTIAHELAHVEHHDPGNAQAATGRRTRGVYAVLTGVFGCALLAGAGAGLLTYLHGPRDFAVAVAGNTTVLVVLLWLAVYLRIGLRREAAAGLAQRPWVELRADLRAVQLVGHAPVLAFLPARRGREAGETWTAAVFGRTHPSSRVRRTAVAAYDPTEDPADAATRLLPALAASAPVHAGSPVHTPAAPPSCPQVP